MASIINATTSTGLVSSADNSGSLQLATNNGTTAVTIDTNQNVGVGVTPSAWRTTFGQKSIQFGPVGFVYSLSASSTNNQVFFGNNWYLNSAGNGIYINSDYALSYSQSFGIHAWSTAPQGTAGNTATLAEMMRITPGGSLCIGRTTNIFGSGAGLCVETNSNSINAVVTNSGQSALSAVNTAVNTGTSCSLMSFNVGISGGGSQVGTVSYNGTLVQYNTTSDQRLKKNIVDAGSGLAKLANVKIRAFDWVEHDSHTDFGVVAQELVTVAPEAVSIGDTGKTIERIWGVDTSTLVPAMIKAIQELNAKVDAQALEIQALKGVA